jgi:L-ascorbate 6-phosphate lactonase
MRPSNALAEVAGLEVQKAQVGILWLGQSGFALRFRTSTVLVDAFLSDHPDRCVPPVIDPVQATNLQVIACTHEHLDHLDEAALPKIAAASPDAVVIVPLPIVEAVARTGIRNRVIGAVPGQPIEVGGLTIHSLPASHGVHPADAYNFGEALSGGFIRYLGYAFEESGVVVYHAGDTIDYSGLGDGIRSLRSDIALVPINGRSAEREARDIVGNLDPEDAARVAAQAQVAAVVPMHYDMFAGNAGEPERRCARFAANTRGWLC